MIDDQLINLFAYSEDEQVLNGFFHFGISREDAKIVAQALREKQQREHPEPLTVEQLREMGGEPLKHWVWIEILDPDQFHFVAISGYYRTSRDFTKGEAFCCGWPGMGCVWDYCDYGKTWLAFAHKPGEEVCAHNLRTDHIAWSTAHSYDFGHPITSAANTDSWTYDDTGASVPENRPCPRCGRFRGEDGIDPCLEKLPGVTAACCGHGIEDGYVLFENGVCIRGKFAVERLREEV